MKRALVTGITGQDGSYLAELLLSKGYEVHGLIRHSSSVNTSRIEHLLSDYDLITSRLFLHYGDLSESANLQRILKAVRPDEIYHLAAQSHVRLSFDMPEYTADVTGVGTVRLLDAVLKANIAPRVYQASSSEMYGRAVESPQTERTPFYPRSPYACAKVFSYWTCVNYREAYGLHVSNGICFNHESPRRGENFVTRKISRAAARIATGKQNHLLLGNLEAMRDWGYAKDYVAAMWMMLQQDEPDDYVIATGETHSVRDFLQEAFSRVGLDWRKHVKLDPALQRPTEVDRLVGDPSKARAKLLWKPTIGFKELVRLMVDEDLKLEGADGRARAA